MAIYDIKPDESWEPRGVKIYGFAELIAYHDGYLGGYLGHTSYLKITRRKKWSWGIEAPVFVDDKFVVNRKSDG